MNLDLSKKVVLDLAKELGIGDQKARVVLALDYSGSMSTLYYNGIVQKVVERLVPIAMAFDNDNAMEVHRFDDSNYKIPVDVTVDNFIGYIEKFVRSGTMGGTNYFPVMEDIVKEHNGGTVSGRGLFGSIKNLFSKTVEVVKQDMPTYVIFITDGDCFDADKALEYIKEISGQAIFWQFVGIGYAYFRTLQNLDTVGGRVVDNANFFQIADTNDLVSMSDDQLYKKLLTEYPQWLVDARSKGIL